MRTAFLLLIPLILSAQPYTLGPDSQRQPGVPRGVVTERTWTSKIYPGTTRKYWIYVPAEYKPDKPACVMIFQDGAGRVTETGNWRAPIVFDNLISKGEIPVTIAIFIDPGVLPAPAPTQQSRFNRSYEYDALGDRYARFLDDEILPEVAKSYNLSVDPNDRAIAGSSSGGSAAFVAAWSRPDLFHRVLSFIGSFTNLRGADGLASQIRKTEPKPLRVFLQDGSADQDIYAGSWFLANQEISAALEYAGYETTFVTGTGAHDDRQGASILPDALRWLWKDHPKPVAKSERVVDRGVFSILKPSQDWEFLGQGYQLTADSAVDKDGSVFFTDYRHMRIYKVDPNGKIALWKENSGGSHGIMFGPDGRLYAGQHYRKRIVAYTRDGKESVVATGIQTHHLAVTSHNGIYCTDAPKHQVWFIDAKGNKRVVTEAVNFPRGVRLSPDESLLVVNDPHTKWVWSFQIQPDGSLSNGQAFYHLETPDESSETDSDGMAFDTEGFLYVAGNLGVQVCDPPGRVTAIINAPRGDSLSYVFFGGPDLQWLYVTDGDKLYRRLIARKGATVWNIVKPPAPRL